MMVLKIDKEITWSYVKNTQLKKDRQLSFELIEEAIKNDKLIDIIHHPKPEYTHQRILIIDIDGYVVLVPYVEDNEMIFLKTAFRSRKMTKQYLRGKSDAH